MKIEVFGTNNTKCKEFFETVSEAAKEVDDKIEVEYVREIEKMVNMGIMASPVLVIDGQAVLAGDGYDKEDIIETIKDMKEGNMYSSGGCSGCSGCGGGCHG